MNGLSGMNNGMLSVLVCPCNLGLLTNDENERREKTYQNEKTYKQIQIQHNTLLLMRHINCCILNLSQM